MMLATSVIDPPLQNVAPGKLYEVLTSLFRVHSIRYVRVQWVDLGNRVRARFLPLPHFLKLLKLERPGFMLTKVALGLVVLQIPSDSSPVGEQIYAIDFSSFRLCSYAPGHVMFFGFFQEHTPVPRPSGLSFEVSCCPRTVLSRLQRYATEQLGIRLLVGVEIEFVLLKTTNPVVPANDHRGSTTVAFTTGTVETRILEEIADALVADGIELEMYHSEGAPGQYEIVTGPLSPLEAADALVHTRETIYNIAGKHGLRATLAPRLAADTCGNGAHMHFSVRGDRSGTSTSEHLTSVESAFLAGLMKHLPSVMPFMLPLATSYDRIVDGIMSCGTWVCWGVDNREAPVRVSRASSPTLRTLEIRSIDGTSNPHLAVASVLACGILGIRAPLELTVKNCDVTRTAAKMSDEERAALGITTRLPLSADEARQRLAADDAIREVLGNELVEHFLRANEWLSKQIDRRDGESEAEALTRLVEMY